MSEIEASLATSASSTTRLLEGNSDIDDVDGADFDYGMSPSKDVMHVCSLSEKSNIPERVGVFFFGLPKIVFSIYIRINSITNFFKI